MCKTKQEEHRAKRRVYQLAWYHRTKHKRGIKTHIVKTREEIRLKQREGERRRYRAQQASEGKTVRPTKQIHFTAEEKRKAVALSSRTYKKKHLERRRKSAREWARRNIERTVARQFERYHTDPVFNLSMKVRRRISTALRACHLRSANKHRTIKLLGCSFLFFKEYIEARFTTGMRWEDVFNGRIHLDHIIPIAEFDVTDLAQQKVAFNYTNMQPLWAADNLSKHAKPPGIHQAELI